MVSGMFEGSDHYAVVAKIRVRGRWEYGKKSKRRQVIACERLDRRGYRNIKKARGKLGEAKMTVGEEISVNVVLNVFKDVVMTVAQVVAGYRVCRDKVDR